MCGASLADLRLLFDCTLVVNKYHILYIYIFGLNSMRAHSDDQSIRIQKDDASLRGPAHT